MYTISCNLLLSLALIQQAIMVSRDLWECEGLRQQKEERQKEESGNKWKEEEGTEGGIINEATNNIGKGLNRRASEGKE